MNLAAISHRSNAQYTYAADSDHVVVTIKTGKDADNTFIICEDPFIHELNRKREWYGKRKKMELFLELENHYIWRIKLCPEYKRLQYYFEIEAEGQIYTLYENKLTRKENENERSKQYFKFPWLNPSDVINPPEWVSNTVWYQIMPERYSRDDQFVNDGRFKNWGDMTNAKHDDFFGGSLKGITKRLPYIKSLGIGGIYTTPVFLSCSNHKYNTFDYKKIDPDFGTEDDMKELIEKAHESGIKIMLDAVFNHSGNKFAPWIDVQKYGEDSPYYDWFFINGDSIDREDFSTADGRFYSFSFWAGMPKLNTNNPDVIDYFTDIASYWVEKWKIDGIRFDVGDEVSHTFLRSLHTSLKKINPDIFLLGEIWNDSLGWVVNKEFDSVMNYPLSSCINDFCRYKTMDSTDFMYSLNHCRSLYPEQVTRVLFNFLDTHDTSRAIESCENEDVLLQKLAALITLPGSPCIYYGTEIAMKGLRTPYNRQCMPWDEIESGVHDEFIDKVSRLIKLRKNNASFQSSELSFSHNPDNPRLICYTKNNDTDIYLNLSQNNCVINTNAKIIYSNKYSENILYPDGILITEKA